MGVFRKNKQWWIDFYHEGKRVRRKVGTSKRLAETVLADVKVKQAKQEFLGICEPDRMRFQDFAVEYLAYTKANKAKNTYHQDRITLERIFNPMVEALYLHEFTLKTLEEYKLRRIERVVPITLNRELALFQGMFRKAVEWGYLKESPFQRIRKLKVPKGTFRVLSQDEANRLLKSCRSPLCRNPQLYPILAVALHTGMRKSEIMQLWWGDVDFKRRRVMVVSRREHHTKNYESRVIPMNDFLYEVLQEHRSFRHLKPYVFCFPDGTPFHDVRTSFEKALERAGIRDMRFHDLRHTFASWLTMSGVDIRTVQELLGHKDISTTMRYAHLTPEHLRSAVEHLSRGMMPCGGGHHQDTAPLVQTSREAG